MTCKLNIKKKEKKYNTYTFKKYLVVWFDVTNHVILRHIKINVVKCEQERYVTSRITLKKCVVHLYYCHFCV